MKSIKLSTFLELESNFRIDRFGRNILAAFKTDIRLNNTYKFSPYRKENTRLHHYKDYVVNVVQVNNPFTASITRSPQIHNAELLKN